MLPKAIIAAMMAIALGVPAGITLTTGGLGPLRFSGSNPEGATASLPVWKAGDTWNYSLTGFSQAPWDHARFQGNLTVKVESVANNVYSLGLSGDLKSRQRVGTDRGIDESRPMADGPPGRFTDATATISGDAQVGVQDLALIMEHVNITGGAKNGNVKLTFFVDVTNKYAPSLPLLKFPLKVGETWDQNVTVKSTGSVKVVVTGPMGIFPVTIGPWDLTFNINRTAKVTAFGNATVPAGKFTAFKVISHRAERDDEGRDDAQGQDGQLGEVEDSQVSAEHMASSMAPHDNDRPMSLLRFSPAETLLYSPDVRNVVAFRLHFPGPLGRTKVVGELKSFHPA